MGIEKLVWRSNGKSHVANISNGAIEVRELPSGKAFRYSAEIYIRPNIIVRHNSPVYDSWEEAIEAVEHLYYGGKLVSVSSSFRTPESQTPEPPRSSRTPRGRAG